MTNSSYFNIQADTSNLKSQISNLKILKILIRLPNWLGDVVVSTAFINAVGQVYDGAVIDVIIKKELSDITSSIPGISKVYPFSKKESKGLVGLYRFGKALRSVRYDLFFNLPSSLSSAVLAKATGAKKRIGFAKEGSFFLMTNVYGKPLNVHRVDEYLYLLEKFTGRAVDKRQVKLDADDNFVPNNKVLINFNSEAISRRMPVEKGKSIINALLNAFPNVRFTLVGSKNDETFVEQLISGATGRNIENLAGKTSLSRLVSLMAASHAVISTDSGPAHLANSVATPVIALFGAGNEYNTAPYNKESLTVIRNGTLGCEPCTRNTCVLYGVPKCMELIDELAIINALRVYLPDAER